MSNSTSNHGDAVAVVRPEYLQCTNRGKAERLLARYQANDPAIVEQFKQFHPSIEQGYEPTLTDAHVMVARGIFYLKDLSLEKLKKDAKRLFKAIMNEEADAVLRAQEFHPTPIEQLLENPKLSDAQLILARENGLASWPKLKKHIESMKDSKQKMASKGFSPDSDLKTLHIRCGTDIEESLKVCGFKGEFFETKDPLPQGPISLFTRDIKSIEAYTTLRSHYIVSAYSAFIPDQNLTLSSCKQDIAAIIQKLQKLPEDIKRIVLWYEHDPYDQLSLSYVLYNLHIQKHVDLSTIKLDIIQIDTFPGTDRFIGMGQICQTPESLLTLWQQRRPLTSSEVLEYAENWKAYCSNSPWALWQFTQNRTSTHSLLKQSNLRMLQELPNTKNGLSLTQQLALQIIHEHQPIRVGQTFLLFNSEYDLLTYYGDVMFFAELNVLTNNSTPALEIVNHNPDLPQYRQFIQLTDTGRQLLNNNINWLDISDAERWIGGTAIKQHDNVWYWDTEEEKVIKMEA